MKRRTLLQALPAAGTLALTGCVSDGTDDASTETDGQADTPESTAADDPADTQSDPPEDTVTESDDGSVTPSDTSTESPTETPEDGSSTTPDGVADESLTVTDSGCGDGEQIDDASVAFDEANETVTVTGTVWGNDACYTAVLSGVSLDGGSLTVVVGSESDADADEVCAECISEIGYEVTVTLDGGLPDEVAVVHEHGGEQTRVTSASP